MLQRDVDWINRHFESLNLTPKFTKGRALPSLSSQTLHPRPDRRGDLRGEQAQPDRPAHDQGLRGLHRRHRLRQSPAPRRSQRRARCSAQVDWRKMTLTNSDNYLRLKRSGIELLGVFCTPKHPMIEVAPGHAQQVHHLRRRGRHPRLVQHHLRPLGRQLGIGHDLPFARACAGCSTTSSRASAAA